MHQIIKYPPPKALKNRNQFRFHEIRWNAFYVNFTTKSRNLAGSACRWTILSTAVDLGNRIFTSVNFRYRSVQYTRIRNRPVPVDDGTVVRQICDVRFTSWQKKKPFIKPTPSQIKNGASLYLPEPLEANKALLLPSADWFSASIITWSLLNLILFETFPLYTRILKKTLKS